MPSDLGYALCSSSWKGGIGLARCCTLVPGEKGLGGQGGEETQTQNPSPTPNPGEGLRARAGTCRVCGALWRARAAPHTWARAVLHTWARAAPHTWARAPAPTEPDPGGSRLPAGPWRSPLAPRVPHEGGLGGQSGEKQLLQPAITPRRAIRSLARVWRGDSCSPSTLHLISPLLPAAGRTCQL